MNILFYDIDGCLHPYDQAVLDPVRQKVQRSPTDGLFVWASHLEQILDDFPDLDLVCHSTWRKFYDLDELRQELSPGLAARTVDLVPPLADRDRAVKAYIEANRLTTKNYAILDDDPWSFPDGTPNLVIVPSATGLSLPAAQNALRTMLTKLNGPAVTDEPVSTRRGPRP